MGSDDSSCIAWKLIDHQVSGQVSPWIFKNTEETAQKIQSQNGNVDGNQGWKLKPRCVCVCVFALSLWGW